MNRQAQNFNDTVDTYTLKPVAKGYGYVFPEFFRVALRNAFDNISFPTVFEQPVDFNPQGGRTIVHMQATSGNGKNYFIKYSMRADSAGHWKVRNFIFEGRNIGLTFLYQFDGAMERYDGKIDEVIANWSSEMAQDDTTLKP